YLQFKGGKGISSTAGYILAYDLRISGICLIAFVAVVSLTKYVSLGSLLVVTINYVMSLIFLGLHWIPVSGKAVPEFIVLITVITALAWIKHRANISRLLKGTENKLSFHGKTDH
ncbi:MAG: glycerol-3-phosphate acyltransferase, partial [Parasporobacterium sp.]|nr:glycerol-3-phosphate acyltransferase [Parasporobacterium sp.]